jgi:hypothetical protein
MGIRIGGNLLITENGNRVLGKELAKSVAGVEGLRG